jgi:hypothetical protein
MAIKPFDAELENELLGRYNKPSINALDKHFARLQLQDFYYRYRDLDEACLQSAIHYYLEDIAQLPEIQAAYVAIEKARIQYLLDFDVECEKRKELEEQLSRAGPFKGEIKAFDRMSIIHEKAGDFYAAIDFCVQAIKYYNGIGLSTEIDERRMHKLVAKAAKKDSDAG